MLREVMSPQAYVCGKMPIKEAWFRPRDRIFIQPSKYFSILKILQYDHALRSLQIHSSCMRDYALRTRDYCDSLDRPPEPRTIVIVLSSTTIYPSYDLMR